MKTKKILDDDFEDEIKKHLFTNEKVIWRGRPIRKKGITLLELGGHYDAASGPSSLLGIILALMIGGGVKFYYDENWIAFVLMILLGIGLMILPEWVKNKRREKTEYLITKNRIFEKRLNTLLQKIEFFSNYGGGENRACISSIWKILAK